MIICFDQSKDGAFFLGTTPDSGELYEGVDSSVYVSAEPDSMPVLALYLAAQKCLTYGFEIESAGMAPGDRYQEYKTTAHATALAAVDTDWVCGSVEVCRPAHADAAFTEVRIYWLIYQPIKERELALA